MMLTARQKEFLDFVTEFEEREGQPPTFREIALGMNVTSKGTVTAIIDILVRDGYLSRRYGKVRGLSARKVA
jgi:SOS-response transcriptional repressor LexA